MSVWTWVLIGLCAAGVLLALVSVVPVVQLQARIRNRVNDLQHARLFTSLESLQLQRAHLESIAANAEPLAKRAQAALQTIRMATVTANVPEMREAMRSAGAEMSAVYEALH